MICWNKIEDFHIEEPTALSLGKFDGVHRGHEALIEHLLEKKKEGLKAGGFCCMDCKKSACKEHGSRIGFPVWS